MVDPGLYRKLYRILSWSSLAGLVITIGLVLHKSAAPEVATDPAAAARAEKKFQAAEQSRAAGQPSQVQLDGTELNSYLAQNLELDGQAPGSADGSAAPLAARTAGGSAASNGSPANRAATGEGEGNEKPTLDEVQAAVKDVKVNMYGDVVTAYVVFDFHGKDVSLELNGHLRAENGYLRFVPISGKLGSLPLPQSTLDSAVEKMLTSPENREKLRLPDEVSDIQIVDGHAVISYKGEATPNN